MGRRETAANEPVAAQDCQGPDIMAEDEEEVIDGRACIDRNLQEQCVVCGGAAPTMRLLEGENPKAGQKAKKQALW
jgi:hypothetical protein